MRHAIQLASGTAILLAAATAAAQMAPGGMGGRPMGGMPGGGGQQPAGEEKKEGVAIAAPKQPGLLPTTPSLPAPKSRRKRWKLIELNGYARVRTDLFKNFNLGFKDDNSPGVGGAPFPQPTSCHATMVSGHPCSNVLAGANMRLRLEPAIYLDEGTSVHIQADALDNLVLGSTPLGTDYSGIYSTTNRPPLASFGSTQGNVTQGVNSDRPSIVVKRAWAEVALPLDGQLKAGRMPDHWGLGMLHNGGGYDPINGTYNYDADFGDSIDRVSLTLAVPGTQLKATAAVDWDVNRLVSNQTSANVGQEGHPFNLDDPSKTNGWVGIIQKSETAQEFRDAVDRGERVLDYGIYFEYKVQDWDIDPTGFKLGNSIDDSMYSVQTHYVQRGLKLYSPDAWLKLGIGHLLVEAEFAAQVGSVAHLDDLGVVGSASIAKLGGVGRATWHGTDRRLQLGFETGFATGDQWSTTANGGAPISPGNPNTPGVLNVAFANLVGDPAICNPQHTCTLSQFTFNHDYIVDLIFWRRMVTAVTNAVYLKPFAQYDVTKSLTLKLWNVTSFAMKPVATPGHASAYGTEFDSDLAYHSGKLHAGVSAGVFLPFSANSHPTDAAFGFSNGNTGGGSPAFAVQSRLVLAF
jgi:uncharacterized protein (TIGR04551 family)